MCLYIINNIASTFLDEQGSLFGHELKGEPEENILLGNLREGSSETAAHAVRCSDVGDNWACKSAGLVFLNLKGQISGFLSA